MRYLSIRPDRGNVDLIQVLEPEKTAQADRPARAAFANAGTAQRGVQRHVTNPPFTKKKST